MKSIRGVPPRLSRMLLLSTALLSCSREKPKTAVPPCALVVQGTRIQCGGRPLPLPGSLSEWERVLGPPSRRLETSPTVHVWDELGLFVGTGLLSPQLKRFVVSWKPRGGGETPESWPRSPFTGRLLVDGAEISSTSRLAEVNRDKKGAPFARGPVGHVSSYILNETPGGVYVGLHFSKDETPELFEIDFAY